MAKGVPELTLTRRGNEIEVNAEFLAFMKVTHGIEPEVVIEVIKEYEQTKNTICI